jgi:hypothetical protein
VLVDDQDGDGVAAPGDCDDLDPAVFPGQFESCNGVDDDDCDGGADDLDPEGPPEGAGPVVPRSGR